MKNIKLEKWEKFENGLNIANLSRKDATFVQILMGLPRPPYKNHVYNVICGSGCHPQFMNLMQYRKALEIIIDELLNSHEVSVSAIKKAMEK